MATSVSDGTNTNTFSYAPDLSRYKQVETNSAGTTTTDYVGGLYEVVSSGSTTQYRHSILAAGGIVAVHTLDQAGVATTSYIHSDHLGSSDAITDDTGTVAQQSSFDAFGLRRDPANWAYDLSNTQISLLKSFTDKGFTDQEQLDSVGLVHMNGRAYDPTIGRFISADPTVSRPLHSQGLNRYSYVENNPLAYVDSTGLTLEIEICCGKYDPQDCCGPGLSDGVGDVQPGESGTGNDDYSSSEVTGQYGAGAGTCGIADCGNQPNLGGFIAENAKNSNKENKADDDTSQWPSEPRSLGRAPGANGVIWGNCGGGNSNCVSMSQKAFNEGAQLWDGVCFCSGGGGGTGLIHAPTVEDGADGGGPNGNHNGHGPGHGSGNGPGKGGAASGPSRGANPLHDICRAGNQIAGWANSVADAGAKLEVSGIVVFAGGGLTAQPEVMAVGLGIGETGGIIGMGAGAMQFGAGLLQGIGGGGYGNSIHAAVTLGMGVGISRLIRGPTTSGYRTVSQRASDALATNRAIVVGGVFDQVTSFIQGLGPQQVSCP